MNKGKIECEACMGSGEVRMGCPVCKGRMNDCTHCRGGIRRFWQPCHICKGKGEVLGCSGCGKPDSEDCECEDMLFSALVDSLNPNISNNNK